MHSDLLPGQSFPLGAATFDNPDGVNFSLFSKNATAVELLFFEHEDDARPSRVIHLDPERNKTFYYWHVLVRGVRPGQLYGYRVHGPNAPEQGNRFDGQKVLLDPYARVVAVGQNYSREAACKRGNNAAHAMKGVVFDPRIYDWEGDVPLQRPFAHSVIYELHVGGFTKHPSSGLEPHKRGTYAGLAEKIPYLKNLGVTAVELLPVQQFDEQDVMPPLKNYWGYNPVNFFAPHRNYSSRQGALGPVNEFRDMVKAFHRAGMEVILDVVFNHTAEGDHRGPTLSFRGLENRAYYILERENRARYANYTGCGNTFKGNHSIVRRLILDCLRYWVREMHVDGFRFDLASTLARDEWGQPLEHPPVLWEIESDPVLAGAKIIAEAWDAGGLYQVGSFIGHRWAEWNGQYRDDVRRFVKGDEGMISRLAARIGGSPDLYPQPDRDPNRSINFVTCHDGFTLNDLVSYNTKHNEANREKSKDGTDYNLSWNYGVEGPTTDPEIESLRLRQIKNFLAILLTSSGTPMLSMGDEARRTQGGNNNAYCQDNELSWFDWRLIETNAGLVRFTRELVWFNRKCAVFQEEQFWSAADSVTWHGTGLNQPDWGHYSHSLAYSLFDPNADEHVHVMLNAYTEPLDFELPPVPEGRRWSRVVDTALPSPADFAEAGFEPIVAGTSYHLEARSVAILISRNKVEN
jgi:glycogen operon protein